MKYVIEIILINSQSPLIMYDESDLSLEDYSKEIKNIFKSSSITTLIFKSNSVTLRPSTLSCINVRLVEEESKNKLHEEIIED